MWDTKRCSSSNPKTIHFLCVAGQWRHIDLAVKPFYNQHHDIMYNYDLLLKGQQTIVPTCMRREIKRSPSWRSSRNWKMQKSGMQGSLLAWNKPRVDRCSLSMSNVMNHASQSTAKRMVNTTWNPNLEWDLVRTYSPSAIVITLLLYTITPSFSRSPTFRNPLVLPRLSVPWKGYLVDMEYHK